ncbi:hypothetical protein CHS0354_037396 [Potamilus streckersoni]|uniref:Uncharacterized protein n=1 Tax=Potamilus streckersoni TaxID=2493646 RepID=A0AAE0VI29_9BIVA|nr:hypothetical protein CHS0354_037396 [Potamilus streckersoni]
MTKRQNRVRVPPEHLAQIHGVTPPDFEIWRGDTVSLPHWVTQTLATPLVTRSHYCLRLSVHSPC